MVDQTENLDVFRGEMLEGWPEGAPIKRADVDALLWWHYHAYADFAKAQLEVQGWSFREKVDEWLLVIKCTEDGLPRVVFVGSVSTTRCVVKLRKLLRGPGVTTIEDKFR